MKFPFRTNADNIAACPTGRDHYYNVVKKDPRFPKPLPGLGNRTEYFNPDEMDAYWALLARTGIENADTD